MVLVVVSMAEAEDLEDTLEMVVVEERTVKQRPRLSKSVLLLQRSTSHRRGKRLHLTATFLWLISLMNSIHLTAAITVSRDRTTGRLQGHVAVSSPSV